jgi:FkbM family methyltransferase
MLAVGMGILTQRLTDKALRKAGLFSTINRSTRVTVAERSFHAPTIHGNRVNPSESWMVELLRKLLPLREGAFLDVGVNLGQTLLKVKALDAERQYVGFEPNATCINYVEKLVQANELENCLIIPAGLAKEPGIVTLDLFGDDSDSSASLIPNFRPRQKVVSQKTVAVLSLNELPSLPKAAIVKIDVEGAELDVLETLLPSIERDRPFLLMEILPSYSAEHVDRIRRQEAIEIHTKTLGYQMQRIIRRGNADALDRLEPVDRICIHGDLSLCDYIIVPREKASMVAKAFHV